VSGIKTTNLPEIFICVLTFAPLFAVPSFFICISILLPCFKILSIGFNSMLDFVISTFGNTS